MHQEGNAVVLQNPATGDTKMRNSGHIFQRLAKIEPAHSKL